MEKNWQFFQQNKKKKYEILLLKERELTLYIGMLVNDKTLYQIS